VLQATVNGEQPFFSPDGQWIGFFAGQELRKISVHGGAAIPLCQFTAPPRGGTWLPDQTIVANLDNQRLFRVPEGGGTPRSLGEPAAHGERSWRWPQAIQDGRAVLFTGSGSNVGPGKGYDDANIDVLTLATGQVKTVARGGYFPRYLPSGHLAYIHQGTLFAVRFDVDHLETRGSALPILDDVAGTAAQGAGQLGFSETGTLVYLNGKASETVWNLSWVDATGKVEPMWGTGSAVLSPKLSPDGRLVVGSTGDDTFLVYDIQRRAATPLALAGKGRSNVWAPDGKHIIYSARSGEGQLGLWWIRADGSSEPLMLYGRKTANMRATSVSQDGKHVVFWQTDDTNNPAVWILPLDLRDPERPQAGTPEVFVERAADGAISPDGHWLAYVGATPTGLGQIYVRPFPKAAGQWQIAENGSYPLWGPKGGELFYRAPLGQIFSVAYRAQGKAFEAAKPVQWSPAAVAAFSSYSPYDVARDGKRFLIYPTASRANGDVGTVRVTVILNFFDELKRRLP
jgi:serine/threonine-protein kinase